jgi:transcriptional regulator with PAS, ATPase and Fis domain/tetratricopeptide (TPR) repeat protein
MSQERLERLKGAVEEAAPGDAKAALEIALAEQLIEHGQYADALVHLGSARRGTDSQALREHIDLSVGVALLRRGELDRAEPHLERHLEAVRARSDGPGEARALVHLAEIYRRRGELDRARTAFDGARRQLQSAPEGDLLSRTLTGLAWLALAAGHDSDGAELAAAALELPESPAGAAARCQALLALAEASRRKGDPNGAERASRQAIAVVTEASLPRELAEAYFAYAHLVALGGNAAASESPATWLARAQDLYREHGSLGDLERVREAFRRFGRRATDHVPANEVQGLIDDLRSARLTVAREAHRLVDTVDVAIGRIEAEIPAPARPRVHTLSLAAGEAERAVSASVESMSASEGRVFAAVQAVISERESIRTLLDLCRTLNEQRDPARLVQEICKMAAQLTGADRALVGMVSKEGTGDGKLEVRASFHMPELPAEGEGAWRLAFDRVLKGGGPILVDVDETPARPALPPGRGASKRSDEVRLGSALATPLRHFDKVLGAVYVDKDLCGGVFTARELDLLAIFCAQAATMLQNVRVTEALRLAARSRAATIEAISDGVVSFDLNGALTSINATAARVLGVQPGSSPSLAALSDLAFLRMALDRGEDLDGRVTRIGAGEFLVNARVVRADGGEVAGVVATFDEMKRVQSIAQRIAGSHARYSFGDLIGQAPALRRRLQLAEAAARSGSSVLITGESGTGKEVLAQAIHNASSRSSGPFVGINCSAIPRELLESELFGYEGGAFTGARKGGRPGKFELAEGGTILLDEIGDMPIEMQAKLLRVLQEKQVHRIGGTREVTLDARVIATTNRDLDEVVARGHFRSDLLFRLKVIHIQLPPLRERATDIPVLVEHFLALFAARLGKSVRALAPKVMESFLSYPWPGNIRELENVLEGEVNLCEPEQAVLDQVPESLRPRAPSAAAAGTLSSGLTLDEAERELLVQALSRHAGSIPDVAKTLGVSRGTVYNKIRRFALDADTFRK